MADIGLIYMVNSMGPITEAWGSLEYTVGREMYGVKNRKTEEHLSVQEQERSNE